MTDAKTPKDRLLEMLVYAPAGLALTAAEEFPRLVEKGRHRVEGQLHTARLVGQFAVQMGRGQLEKTVANLVPRGQAPSPARPTPAAPVPTEAAEADPPTSPARSVGADSDSGPAAEPAPVAAPAAGTTAASSNGTMGSSALGIPGYDSLSASQVVQRLGGLSPSELDAVRSHELAHRHRRTILNRVEQLLAGAERG